MTHNKHNLTLEATALMTDPFPGSPLELRNSMSALTSSSGWLRMTSIMYEPPIIALDSFIALYRRRLHPTLGVMTSVPDPDPVPSADAIRQGPAICCASALVHVFARLTIMQSNPECVHVFILTLIYTPDRLYLPQFCGVFRFFPPSFPSPSTISPKNGVWNKWH